MGGPRAADGRDMTSWAWTGISLAALGISSSVVVALAVGKILATIEHAASELLDEEHFASSAPARAR